MGIDVKNEHQYHNAKYLGSGSAVDMNNVKTPGVYAVTNPDNGPGTGDWFVTVTRSTKSGVVHQVAVDQDDGVTVKVRLYASAAWGSWGAAGFDASAAAVTSGASPVALTEGIYRHNITTGGTAGSESVTLPDGQYVGQRLLIHESVRTNASDVIAVSLTKLAAQSIVGDTAEDVTIAAMTLDAAGDYVLLEWTGLKWNILYTNGTFTIS
jgi:hypothetical protein